MPAPQGNYWIIALDGQPTYQNTRQGYRKIAFQRDSKGQLQARILEIIPEGHRYQRTQIARTTDFTGSILVYNERYQLISGKILANGTRIGSIRPDTPPGPGPRASAPDRKISQPHNLEAVEITQNCQWYDNNYIDGNGELVVFSQQICSYDVSGGGGEGFDGGSGDYAGNAGGGGGTSTGAPSAPNLPGETGPKVNPKALMDCFQSIPDQGATMKITIYVQEPWPGTSFAIGPNSVGHTAIGLTKTNGSTSITQVLGFYPDASGLSKMHAPSKILDNGGDINYNSSITFNVTASQFQQIANYIANPPSIYDLDTFNCTDFVLSACAMGNIKLPRCRGVVGTTGPNPGFAYGNTPAGLGSSLEKMKGQNNVNTSGGTTPNSKGPCIN